METDLNKIFYGEEAAQRLNQFKEGMLDIENKHLDYFNDRVSKDNAEEKDRLHNYYLMIVNSNGVTFRFNENSDLDKEIQTSCIQLFNRIFNPTN
jgi:hypothetical protein